MELADARESRDYWHARARALPRHRMAARREARELARRWDERLDAAARRELLLSPAAAIRALIDVRIARLTRGARRVALIGVGAVFAAGAMAGLALDVAWHALRALLG
jgi:hypothetical protein